MCYFLFADEHLRIDRNAKASPLLRLPLEIRKRIWTFTIGNRLLHINTVNCERHENDQACWCSEKLWRTLCCFAPHSEDSIFERSKIPIDDLITTDEASCGDFVDSTLTQQLPSDASQAREVRKAAITGHPHSSCRALIANLRSGQKETLGSHQLVYHKRKEYALPVQLLRVCRQIYIESNPLLWSTNTLSFENMTDFKTFMSNRIRAQRANITSLHLDLTDNHYCNSRYASSAATLGIVKSLVGLRSLHVYLSDNLILDPLATMAGDDESAQIDNWKDWVHEESGGKELTNYRILDLTNVTVLMAIAKIGVFRYPPTLTASHSLEKWRRGERTDYAEKIRQTILDADGAQKLKKEQADAKAARAAEIAEMEENKLTDPPCPQASTVDECAGMTQKRRKNGKAPPCPKDHVCLICFNDLDKSRDGARQCPKPGACVGECEPPLQICVAFDYTTCYIHGLGGRFYP